MSNPFSKFSKNKERPKQTFRVDDSEWEVRTCPEGGDDCWCRMIYVKDTNLIVIPGAVIKKDMAEYIVKLQNESL